MKKSNIKGLKKAQNGTSIYGDPSAYNNIGTGADILKAAGAAYLGEKTRSQAYFNALLPKDADAAAKRSNLTNLILPKNQEEATQRAKISPVVSGVIGGASAALSQYAQRKDYEAYQKQIAEQKAGEYYRLPVDQYSYNEYLDNPYNNTAYKHGGKVRYNTGGEVGNDWESEDPKLDMPETDQDQEQGQSMQRPREQVRFDSTIDEYGGQQYDQGYPTEDYSGSEDEFPMNENGIDIANFTPTLGNIPTRLATQADDIEKIISGIGYHESRGDYSLVNNKGGEHAIYATGKYQFVPKYWYREIAQFQGTTGKSMEETMEYFRTNPQVQEGFMRHVVNKYYLPEVKRLLPLAKKYGIDQEGLIKLMHYRGIADARNRLRTGDFSVAQEEKVRYNNPDIMSYIKS